MKYTEILNSSWENYQAQSTRKHGIIGKKFSKSIADYFSCFFYQNKKINGRAALHLMAFTNDRQATDAVLKEKIIKYILNHPPRHLDSFTNYLLDELIKNDPEGGWELYEENAVMLHSDSLTPLYRGINYNPDIAFKEGLKQHYTSPYLDSYTSSQNGGVGNSTSLNYNVALDYAAPKPEVDPELQRVQRYCKRFSGNSYIYVIHNRQQQHKAINIPKTHYIRNNLFQYITCAHEDEVNIAADIPPEDIYCAFKIDRSTREITATISNPIYRVDSTTNSFKNAVVNSGQPIVRYANTTYDQSLIDQLNMQNFYSNLHELSRMFFKIKYDDHIKRDTKNNLLLTLRKNALAAFLKTIRILPIKEQNDAIHSVRTLKIFSESRGDSLWSGLFKTSTQCLLEDHLTKHVVTDKRYRYPSRVI